MTIDERLKEIELWSIQRSFISNEDQRWLFAEIKRTRKTLHAVAECVVNIEKGYSQGLNVKVIKSVVKRWLRQ